VGTSFTTPDVVLPYPGQAVFAAAVRALSAPGFRVLGADATTGVVHGELTMSLWSWGENLRVQVWQTDPESPSSVRISSWLKFGLVDWGRNRRNVERLQAAMASILEEDAAAGRLSG